MIQALGLLLPLWELQLESLVPGIGPGPARAIVGTQGLNQQLEGSLSCCHSCFDFILSVLLCFSNEYIFKRKLSKKTVKIL